MEKDTGTATEKNTLKFKTLIIFMHTFLSVKCVKCVSTQTHTHARTHTQSLFKQHVAKAISHN